MIEPAENQEVEIAEIKESDALPEKEQYMSVSTINPRNTILMMKWKEMKKVLQLWVGLQRLI